MTADQFNAALREAGYASRSDFARQMQIAPATISRWFQPPKSVPTWAIFLLQFAAKARKYNELTAALTGAASKATASE